MIFRVLVTSAGLLLLGVVSTRSSHAESVRYVPASRTVQASLQVDPKPLYTKLCEPCHGRDGKAPAPEMGFIAREWKHGSSTAEIIKSVTVGVPGTAMLPFKGKLKEPEIAALASYVRSLDKRLKPEKGGGSD